MVVRSAVGVLVTPGYSILSPPTVKLTQRVSCFLNLMLHTVRKYVALNNFGMSLNATKKHVFMPLCSFQACDIRPRSLHMTFF